MRRMPGTGIIVVQIIFVLLATIVIGSIDIPRAHDDTVKVTTLNKGSRWQQDLDFLDPITTNFNVFVWNVTNPNLNFTAGEKPRLEQVGPYVFTKRITKEYITINETEDSIEYRQRNTYFYNQEASGGRDQHLKNLNIINTPFISVSRAIYRTAPVLAPFFIDRQLVEHDGERFVRQSVSAQEMMFDGFELPPAYETIIGLLPVIPIEFTNNRFAYYNQRNATLEQEVYKVNAGKQDPTQLGHIMEWDGKPNLNYWKVPDPDLYNSSNEAVQNSFCNMINGTDGRVFASYIEKESILRIFETDMCRSIHLTFYKDAEHLGIPGYVFTMPPDFYEYPAINEDNYCFCTSPLRFSDEYPINRNCSKGVLRLGPCKAESPVVTSNPHFLFANDDYLDYVDGLSPNVELHKTEILVEPRSGNVLKSSKKIQTNIEMQPLIGTSYFNDVPYFLWPAYWVDEVFEINTK